jgi:hypothetical protein
MYNKASLRTDYGYVVGGRDATKAKLGLIGALSAYAEKFNKF